MPAGKIKLRIESNRPNPGSEAPALKKVMSVGVELNKHFHPLQKYTLSTLLIIKERYTKAL